MFVILPPFAEDLWINGGGAIKGANRSSSADGITAQRLFRVYLSTDCDPLRSLGAPRCRANTAQSWWLPHRAPEGSLSVQLPALEFVCGSKPCSAWAGNISLNFHKVRTVWWFQHCWYYHWCCCNYYYYYFTRFKRLRKMVGVGGKVTLDLEWEQSS